MNATQIIEELGKALNVDLSLSTEGTCSISFGQDCIEFEGSETELYMIAPLGSLLGKEHLYKNILENNFLGLKTAFSTLSIEKDTLMLHKVFHAPIDYAFFEECFTLFLSSVRYWKEWLEKAEDTQEVKEDIKSLSAQEFRGMLRA